VQVNECCAVRRFLELYFIHPLREEKNNKKKWYQKINLDAYVTDPLGTYNKIAVAEMLMEDYKDALKTINYVLTSEPSNATALYLRGKKI